MLEECTERWTEDDGCMKTEKESEHGQRCSAGYTNTKVSLTKQIVILEERFITCVSRYG